MLFVVEKMNKLLLSKFCKEREKESISFFHIHILLIRWLLLLFYCKTNDKIRKNEERYLNFIYVLCTFKEKNLFEELEIILFEIITRYILKNSNRKYTMYTLYKFECLFEKRNTISLFVFSFSRSTWEEAGATRGRALLDEDQQVASSVVGMSSVCMQLGRDRARPSGWGYARHGTVLHGRRGRIPSGREGKRTRSRSWLQSGRRVCTALVLRRIWQTSVGRDALAAKSCGSRVRVSVTECVELRFTWFLRGERRAIRQHDESRVCRWCIVTVETDCCAQPSKRRKDTGTKKRTVDDVGARPVPRSFSKRDSWKRKSGGGKETVDDDGKIYHAIQGETAALSRAATCLRRLRIATLRNFRWVKHIFLEVIRVRYKTRPCVSSVFKSMLIAHARARGACVLVHRRTSLSLTKVEKRKKGGERVSLTAGP